MEEMNRELPLLRACTDANCCQHQYTGPPPKEESDEEYNPKDDSTLENDCR